MKSRRSAREAALQALYACDSVDTWTVETVDTFFTIFHPEVFEDQTEVPEELMAFSKQLILGVCERRQEIDAHISSASTRWSVNRMCRVDRNIIRVATFELAYLPEVPASVCLNEAIEIAKRFGAEDSPTFVNGVLDKVAQLLRPDAQRSRSVKKAVNE